jgi:hypothetical protein
MKLDDVGLARALAGGVLTLDQVAPPPDMPERDFTRLAITVARALGWRVAHFRSAMMRSGRWATPVQGDGVGWPDLILVRGKRLLAVELKSQFGRLRPEQRDWLDALGAVPGATCAAIRPTAWAVFCELLEESS